MGLIDDIAAKYVNGDPELARVYEESYMEGIHSAWSIALMSAATEQNMVANAESMRVEAPVFTATNDSSRPRQAFAPA